MKYSLHIIIALCLMLAGCGRNSEIDRQMDTAERIMIDEPIEALTILSKIDTLQLSESQKGMRALLEAYISVTWRIPIDISEGDINRVMHSYVGDCSESEVKSLIVKSEIENANGNPISRIEYLKDAEFLAVQLEDNTDLGFIYLYLSQVYEKGFNGIVSEYYADKSRTIFEGLGHKKQSIDARMAQVGATGIKRDYKTMCDSLESMCDDVMRYATDSYKVFFLDQLARSYSENYHSKDAINIWYSIYGSDSLANSNTLSHWANAYVYENRLDSALILIEKAVTLPHNNTDEYLCRNVQYDILQRLGRTSELPAIDSLRAKANNALFEEKKLEETSNAINLKYESATQEAWRNLQLNKVKTVYIVLGAIILLLIAMCILIFYRRRNRMLQLEHDNDILKIQNLQNDLFESENRHDTVSLQISSILKSRFAVIDKLASSYFECKETGTEQKKIFAEVKNIMTDFGSAASMHELENIVDIQYSGLMRQFNEDFPGLSKAQRKLATLIFCRLSPQAISIFMGADIHNIYVYKSRLKSTISKSESPRKSIYLEYFT